MNPDDERVLKAMVTLRMRGARGREVDALIAATEHRLYGWIEAGVDLSAHRRMVTEDATDGH